MAENADFKGLEGWILTDVHLCWLENEPIPSLYHTVSEKSIVSSYYDMKCGYTGSDPVYPAIWCDLVFEV